MGELLEPEQRRNSGGGCSVDRVTSAWREQRRAKSGTGVTL